jgi:hypothetical protein
VVRALCGCQVEVPGVAIPEDVFAPCASGHFVVQSGTSEDALLPCWDVITGVSVVVRNGDILVAVNGASDSASPPSRARILLLQAPPACGWS